MTMLTARNAVGLSGWLAFVPVMLWLACSDGSSNGGAGGHGGSGGSSTAHDVSGAWCGLQVATAAECVGDEVIYAEFAQSGAMVTGQSCERYLTACYAIDNGSVDGDVLAFDYTFSSERVDAKLTLSADGKTLMGTYTSTKCACDVPVTLHRLP